MGRAPCCDKANVKRGPWSPEEDAKLKSYIEKHGTGGNWIALPQKIGLKRCGKSCRLRWLNYLRPNIKHGGFTEDEDNLICSLYISIGSRWSIIAAQLPGRTDNDIKNYWNTRLKKKLLGRQRIRDQQARRQTKTEAQNYHPILNYDYFNLYPHQPPPPPTAAEPLLQQPDYQTQLPPTQLLNVDDVANLGNLCYNLGNSEFHGNMITSVSSSSANDFQPFDQQINPEDVIYRVAQQLDGAESIFSAAEMVINSSEISWQDQDQITNCLFYPCAVSNYQVSQRKTQQDWTVFEEPRLLGYSE